MFTIEKQIAERALEIIKKGWHQGSYFNHDESCFCALGAINRACEEVQGVGFFSAMNQPETETVARRLDGIVGGFVPNWNDDPDRTKEEVVTAFEKLVASYA
ncbi:DUF6197 family protein [Faunimonas sp. B44]|uniref:DUF6197 family protein n=1 Tax=Faunimonas sp. B44 TaxID=3461493 RepID=UPI0040449509